MKIYDTTAFDLNKQNKLSDDQHRIILKAVIWQIIIFIIASMVIFYFALAITKPEVVKIYGKYGSLPLWELFLLIGIVTFIELFILATEGRILVDFCFLKINKIHGKVIQGYLYSQPKGKHPGSLTYCLWVNNHPFFVPYNIWDAVQAGGTYNFYYLRYSHKIMNFERIMPSNQHVEKRDASWTDYFFRQYI